MSLQLTTHRISHVIPFDHSSSTLQNGRFIYNHTSLTSMLVLLHQSVYFYFTTDMQYLYTVCTAQKNCTTLGIGKARNDFSFILSNSESAHDFAEALKVLPRHASDEHKWDGGKCTFHELKVCSCGKCEDDADLKCDGKDYHTRQILKCPMHSLAYKIECH